MRSWISSAALAAAALALAVPATTSAQSDLWKAYNQTLSKARYIDLTHTITPNQPVWKGFGPATFKPAVDPTSGTPYTYAKDGFEATAYTIATDQFGTQFDPPAHWAPEYAAIDEVPATYSVRPLVVINMAPATKKDPKAFLHVKEVKTFEKKHGRIPAGSVVFVRTDWSNRWTTDPEQAKALAADANFPSVGLDALKFLHLKRHILFHGHEPLDTDSTPTLEGEHWLMHHGFAQAEGVADLDKVKPTGCLIEIGYPKFGGGLGGYARFIAICPHWWRHGVSVGDVPEAPLRRFDTPLHYDATAGMRL